MKFNWNKRYTQGVVVLGSLMVMTFVTVFGGVSNASKAEVAGSRVAGIVAAVSNMEGQAYAKADVEASGISVVAKGNDNQANKEWANRLMAKVDEFLYVRAAADGESEVVGKMYKGNVAEVVSFENDWYHIKSGNVDGYVSAEFCVVGDEAMALANEVCTTYATATEGGIRLRKEASAEAGIVTVLYQGEKIEVDLDAPVTEGWVAVRKDGNTGYVSAEFVEVAMDMGQAITVAEEQAIIAAKKAEEEAAAAAAARKQAQRAQNEAVAANADDVTLLAALIQSEAGNECYEGKVAVGAVVVNRVRSGGYPSSVYGVVFQPSQFTPAGSGRVSAIVSSGPSASCMQAAQEALNGVDYTGGALCFRPVSSGRGGVVIGNHVFF